MQKQAIPQNEAQPQQAGVDLSQHLKQAKIKAKFDLFIPLTKAYIDFLRENGLILRGVITERKMIVDNQVMTFQADSVLNLEPMTAKETAEFNELIKREKKDPLIESIKKMFTDNSKKAQKKIEKKTAKK